MKTQFLSEAHVTKQVRDFLLYRGWRAHRLNTGKWVPWAEAMRYAVKFGTWRVNALLGGSVVPPPKKPVPREWSEEGSPDWLYVHPKHGALYVEIKAEGKRPKKLQQAYLDRLAKDGYAATWTNRYEDFEKWYHKRFR